MWYILGATCLSFVLGALLVFSNEFRINKGSYNEDGAIILVAGSCLMSGGIVACLMWYFLH